MKKYTKEFSIDKLETLAEEIRMNFNLQVDVNTETMQLDVHTMFGLMHATTGFKTMMEDFYRFVYCYGGKLQSYGIESRVKGASNKS
jgi:hypothetical protein